MVNTIQPRCTHKDCSFYGKCLEDNVLMRRCAEGGMHKEDYYWLTGEILTEEQFIQDCTDGGLFLVSQEELMRRQALWEASVVKEHYMPYGVDEVVEKMCLPSNYLETTIAEDNPYRKPKKHGHGSTAEGPDEVNL